ncbi:hypothetical protein KKH36_03435 [Patescibacteria group bacterium]|nr:hypothetical protein [Patescibacteria group bacterium]
MLGVLTKTAEKQYLKLPKKTQLLCDKQIDFLLENYRHSSLNSKKYDKSIGLWQARIDKFYRFYFLIQEDKYIIVSIKKHPK